MIRHPFRHRLAMEAHARAHRWQMTPAMIAAELADRARDNAQRNDAASTWVAPNSDRVAYADAPAHRYVDHAPPTPRGNPYAGRPTP